MRMYSSLVNSLQESKARIRSLKKTTQRNDQRLSFLATRLNLFVMWGHTMARTLDLDWELTAALNFRHETRQREDTPKAHRHKRYNHNSLQHCNHEPSGRDWDEDTGYSETGVFIFRSRVAVCIMLECPGRMLTHEFFRSTISKLKSSYALVFATWLSQLSVVSRRS